jgi:glycosyltransferase involved in cell wall biosynthesis
MSQSPLRVVLVLKTAEGGLWTLPHVDELRRRGHTVIAVLPSKPGGRLRQALAQRGVSVVDAAFSFQFRPGPATVLGLWRLRRQIRALLPDVVHYHLYASALATRLATIGLGLPRVHMVAGPLYLESRLIRQVERVLTRLDDVTIGGSAYTSRRYRSLGLPAPRTPAIAYGVDTFAFTPPSAPERSQARSELGFTGEHFVVVMVAYVYAPKRSVQQGRGVKGHDVLLSAWRGFGRCHPQARLLIAGGGFDEAGEAYRRELAERFELDRDASVHWLPTLADVRGLYSAADVSVSPSLSDNHGAALEAGAMGVPCIVSDAGALPETVDERSGWVIPRDDVPALVRALEQAYTEFTAGTLAGRGEQARERVARLFDRQVGANRVVDVIEAAVAARRAGRR